MASPTACSDPLFGRRLRAGRSPTHYIGFTLGSLTMGRVMKSKKRCCKDRPRCKSCPGVCKRLEKLGYASARTGARGSSS